LGEIRTHRRLAVLACALGLAHFEVTWGLLFLVLCASITATTRATLTAIAVTRTAAIVVAVVRALARTAFTSGRCIGVVLALGRRNRVPGFVQTRATVIATAPSTAATSTFTAFAALAAFTRSVVVAVGIVLRSRLGTSISLAFAIFSAFGTLAAFTAIAVASAAPTACGARTLGAVGVYTYTLGVVASGHRFSFGIKTLALAAAFPTASTASTTAIASFTATFATAISAALATAFAACATSLAIATALARRASITALVGFGCGRLAIRRR